MSITFFFFNDTATTEIYTLSLHDALPIWSFWRRVTGLRVLLRLPGAIGSGGGTRVRGGADAPTDRRPATEAGRDRKSTRLNSRHSQISYAVFCLEKKKK